jgi:hypothetical protein
MFLHTVGDIAYDVAYHLRSFAGSASTCAVT